MPRNRRVLAAVTLTAAVGLTAACGPADPDPASTSTTTSTSTSTSASPSSSTTTTETAEEKDARSAAAAISSYWAMLDQLAATPTKSLTDLSTVAVDPALEQWQIILTKNRAAQFTQVGSTVVDAPKATKNAAGEWDVSACIDVSKTNLVDKDGRSVISADRPPRVAYSYVVKKIKDNFFVTQEQAVGTC